MLGVSKTLIDILFPPHSEVLRSRTVDIQALSRAFLICSGPDKWITVGFSYSNIEIRSLVRANKYYGEKSAGEKLGIFLEEILSSVLEEKALSPEWKRPLLIPMPASKARFQKRGYNQVHRIITPSLSHSESLFLYRPKTLCKHDRKTQLSVPLERRNANIHEAFYVPENTCVQGQCAVLIDDVSETGATMRDAKRALMEAGARDVIGVAIAR